jgi:hypothetical protein
VWTLQFIVHIIILIIKTFFFNHLKNFNQKNTKTAGCWWLMPTILAAQETDQEDHGSKTTNGS